jgi:hypothetical protein
MKYGDKYRFKPCRNKMHDRSLLRVSKKQQIWLYGRKALTDCILLLLGHEQFPSIAIPHSHTLTERPQLAIIFLVFPDLQEGLAILQLQVVVLSQTRVLLAM